jgi:hypothetical protein
MERMIERRKTSDAMSRKINHIARCGAERALKRAQLDVGWVWVFSRVKPPCCRQSLRSSEEEKSFSGNLGTTRVSVVSVCWRWGRRRLCGVVCGGGGNIFSRSWSSSPLLSSFIWGQGMLKSVLSVKGIKGFRRVGLALFFVRNNKNGVRDGIDKEMDPVGLCSVASLWANKVPFLYGDGEKAWCVCLCVVAVDGGEPPWGGQMKVLVQYKSRVRSLFLG